MVRGDRSGQAILVLFTAVLLFTLARSGAVPVSARLSGAVSGRRVVIDPGHGGPDPGAVGRSGLREKDLVLEIAFHLRRLLGRAGVYVTMTRETDRDFGGGRAPGFLPGPQTARSRSTGWTWPTAYRADVYLSDPRQ